MKIAYYICTTVLLICVGVSSVAQVSSLDCNCLLGDSALKNMLGRRLDSLRTIKLSRDSSDLIFKKLQQQNEMKSMSFDPSLKNHFLNYNMGYVSRMEGMHDYSDIFQHNVTYKTDVSVINNIPLSVMVNGRFSNSSYFRNYVDVSINLKSQVTSAVAEQQKLLRAKYLQSKATRLRETLKSRIREIQNLQDSFSVNPQNNCFNAYIHCKEILSNARTYLDTNLIKHGPDSVRLASNFIQLYEARQRLLDSVKHQMDVLKGGIKRKLDEFEDLLHYDKPDLPKLTYKLSQHYPHLKSLDTSISNGLPPFVNNFKKLTFGKSFPSLSQVNFQNVSVNGINAEYQLSTFFIATHAGWTDLGFRNFVFNKAPKPVSGFVYSTGVGWGSLSKDYLMLSVFGGANKENYQKENVLGSTLSMKVIKRNLSFQGEVAQMLHTDNTSLLQQKSRSWLSNHSNRAYSGNMYGFWRSIGLSTNAYYKYFGINYHGFNSYRMAANNALWGLEADKSFFRQTLNIVASVKKNDYKNPYVSQVFDGKNIVQNYSVSYRKQGFPFISAGYIPSFQYVSVNDTIYENNYQVMNLLVSYPYRIGLASATSDITINKYQDGSDKSAYFYSRSLNVMLNQSFRFEKYGSGLGVSVLSNPLYTYTIFDVNLAFKASARWELRGGFKVNNLEAEKSQSTLGSYGNIAGFIPRVGQLSISFEKGFFPDINRHLVSNTRGALSFTTYFK